MLVWSVYTTKSQHATAQSHAVTLSRDEVARQNRAIKSQVWHRSKLTWNHHYGDNRKMAAGFAYYIQLFYVQQMTRHWLSSTICFAVIGYVGLG